tara:strand:- start:610 stop:828 length:219 start_codon:yes stop_codon:yes gene_type:complete
MPKTVQKWAEQNSDKINDLYVEKDYADGHDTPYSIWCSLKEGWINQLTETTSIHESSVKEFMDNTKYIKRVE